MFTQSMEAVEKENEQKISEREKLLNEQVIKLSEELQTVVKHATQVGSKYKTLREGCKEKENRHGEEMDKMTKIMEAAKSNLL